MAQPADSGGQWYFTSGQAEEQYIFNQAKAIGVDPEGVLAVAAHEGGTLPGTPGDYGIIQNGQFIPEASGTQGGYDTSFGPWGLHATGALPSNIWSQGPAYANEWANSPAGITYALQGIKSDIQKAGGQLQGVGEVVSQVEDFEHPAASDEPGEIHASIVSYQANAGPNLGSGLTSTTGIGGSAASSSTTGSASGTGLNAVFGSIGGDVSGSIEEAFLRFGELLLALILGYIALKSLNRYFGAARSAAAPATSVVTAPGRAGYSVGQSAYGVATTGVMTA